MTINGAIEKLVHQLGNDGYQEIPPLLNGTNEDLFIGHSNLFQADKIISIKVFSKLVFQFEELEYLKQADRGMISKSQNLKLDQSTVPISNHMICLFTLGQKMTSHPNIIHGGAIATLIDEYFVKVTLPLTEKHFAVTAGLEIQYLKPIKISTDQSSVTVVLDCFIAEMALNRKFVVQGSIKTIDGEKYCDGRVNVVVPKFQL